MPMGKMKESSEKHFVIKSQLQNIMNTKNAQNGKGPPSQEPQNQSSPPSRTRGRRRGRGGRKSDQADAFMRPSSRPCTGTDSPVIAEATQATVSAMSNGLVGNGGSLCEAEVFFPSSTKSLSFAPRPGYGQLGTRCIVKANHFFAELPDKDLIQYDVSSFS